MSNASETKRMDWKVLRMGLRLKPEQKKKGVFAEGPEPMAIPKETR